VAAKPHWSPSARRIGPEPKIDPKVARAQGKRIVPCIGCGIDCMVPQDSGQTWERCGMCTPAPRGKS
jgi:hypothetical protein